MKTTYLKRAEMRRGLVCLVPREGAYGLTCHEKTICDCRVIELLDDLDTQESELTKLRKRVEVLEFALKEISTAAPRDDEHGTAHASNYYRLKASFNRANQALAESAKIAGE